MTIHRINQSRRGQKADQVIDHLVISMAGELVAEGLDRARAADAALRAVKAVCRDFGGEELYFPKATTVPRTETAAKLFEAWRAGATFGELADRYGFSSRWVRILVGEAREARAAAGAAQTR